MFTPNSILRGLVIAASLSTVAFAQSTQGHYGFGRLSRRRGAEWNRQRLSVVR